MLYRKIMLYAQSHNTTRESMFAFQWREFSPPLSSAHSLLQCYHSQWEIGDAAIPGEFPLSPRHYRPISQWASSLEWRHAMTLHIMVGKICISFFLFYCEGMLSLVVSWFCGCMHDLSFLNNLILGAIVIFCFTGLIFSIQYEIFHSY